ncbi:hypothetical protein MMC25_003210 [Agyrium rufum]|nr:hypothetical protein [Agyrium rufum]
MDFQYLNIPSTPTSLLPTPDSSGKITLKTSAPTDVWRKPPSHDVFNAPYMYKALPISRFKNVRVSAVGEWTTLYDQGGMMIVLPATRSRPDQPPNKQKRWIKTGIEFYQGKPMMSVVAADLWADWSLLPLSAEDEKDGRMSVVAEREREEDGSWGSVLRISLVGRDGKASPVREVTWAFYDLDEEAEMWVGMAVAKPTVGGKEVLEVTFEGFEVEMRD